MRGMRGNRKGPAKRRKHTSQAVVRLYKDRFEIRVNGQCVVSGDMKLLDSMLVLFDKLKIRYEQQRDYPDYSLED